MTRPFVDDLDLINRKIKNCNIISFSFLLFSIAIGVVLVVLIDRTNFAWMLTINICQIVICFFIFCYFQFFIKRNYKLDKNRIIKLKNINKQEMKFLEVIKDNVYFNGQIYYVFKIEYKNMVGEYRFLNVSTIDLESERTYVFEVDGDEILGYEAK